MTSLSHLSGGSHANEKSKCEDEPPEPGILVPHQLSRPLDDQSPLGKGEAEPGKSAVPGCDGVTETHQQQESHPVEEKRREECPAVKDTLERVFIPNGLK